MSPSLKPEQLDLLDLKLFDQLDDLIAHLGADLRECGSKLIGPCPIHGGEKTTSFKLFTDGYSRVGNWICHSHHCEETFQPTLLGFVRGILSHVEKGWCHKGDPLYPFVDTLEFVFGFLKITAGDLVVDTGENSRRLFIRQIRRFGQVVEQTIEGWNREKVRSWMNLPASYYVDRGYPPDLLDRYDVGLARCPASHPLAERVLVPIYDSDYRQAIGLTGRSIYPSCSHCKAYHHPERSCPAERERDRFCKWKTTRGLRTEQHLYNFWFAREVIERERKVVLVEGPGDVWRLVQAGVYPVVGLFGCSIEDGQQILLESSGALDVILLLDNDRPGQEAAARIKSRLGRLYRVHTPVFPFSGKDVGDTAPEVIREHLLPFLSNIK